MSETEKSLRERLDIRGDRESVFRRMFEHLRREVPNVSNDPSLADPALMLLLKSLSAELEQVYGEIESSGERTFKALIRRLLSVPRGSRPAQTVAYYEVLDPGLEIGPADALVCQVPRVVDGQKVQLSLEFRPRFSSRLGEYAIVATVRVDAAGAARLEITPPPGQQAATTSDATWRTAKPLRPYLMFCVEVRKEQPSVPAPSIFIDGPEPLVHATLWGRWQPVTPHPDRRGSSSSGLWSPATYVPAAVTAEVEDVLSFRSDRGDGWGIYAGRFVGLPLADAQPGPEPALLREAPVKLPPARGARWWWQVEFAGDPNVDFSGVRLRVDCVPVENREIKKEERIVPDLTRQGIELPVKFDELEEIEEVLDLGAAQVYRRAEDIESAGAASTYRLRPAPETGRITVWLTNPKRERESSRIQVQYSTNVGPLANEIKAGSIERLLRPKPGVKSVANVVETVGGREARAQIEVEEEVRGVLRHHGRAVALQDYRDLALALGAPFVRAVGVRPGVRLTPLGARRGVIVSATIAPELFVSDLQEETVREDLERRLSLKSPVGTMVQVEFSRQ